TDPITAYYGGQLISGARAGRVISESSGMASFEVLTAHILDALYFLSNAAPTSAYWSKLTGPAPWSWFELANIPPPPGAPYSSLVYVATIGVLPALTPTEYQAANGFPIPTNQQIVDFLNAGQMLTWQQVPDDAANGTVLDQLMHQQVVNRYGAWLGSQPVAPTPPVGPQPPTYPVSGGQGDEFVDCCNSTQANLQAILSQLVKMAPQDGATPSADCCAQILAELTTIAGIVGGLPSAIAGAIPGSPAPTDLTAIVNALDALKPIDPLTCAQITILVQQIVDVMERTKGLDLVAVVQQLTRIADAAAIPASAPSGKLRALCEYLDLNGMGDSALTQILLL
ncbi:MAG TPA: hypothetical protein VJ376_05665, partial [Pseudomonadota bacterium]|nr:hypothetical protein [Pseudomonadota bacterium]